MDYPKAGHGQQTVWIKREKKLFFFCFSFLTLFSM